MITCSNEINEKEKEIKKKRDAVLGSWGFVAMTTNSGLRRYGRRGGKWKRF